MKAVVLRAPHRVVVESVPDPRIEAPTDAILKITSAALCGSDLHMYDGRTVVHPGIVMGHEPLGVIQEVGEAVVSVKPGERVVVPFNIACGFCFNCARGLTSACLLTNPESAGAAYGYVGMGPFRGAQAEYLRIPFADINCTKLPGTPYDSFENDFVLLADVFPTGIYANELSGVTEGSTVAIFGAGPVGLLSAYCAILLKASEVYVVDSVPERLELVRRLGAEPIDFLNGDPVEQIIQKRRDRPGKKMPGEEKMPGVMCGIEAVGYQAIDWRRPGEENPICVVEDLIRLVNPTGRIGIVGLYVPYDPGGLNPHAKKGEFNVSFGKLWEKGISIGTGQTPVKRYIPKLLNWIIHGRGKVKPGTIVSHTPPLTEAPIHYERFARHEGDCVKVVFRP